MKKYKNILIIVLLMGVLSGGLYLGYWIMSPVKANTEEEGYQSFLNDTKMISRKMHPSQSEGIEEVRDYLDQQLKETGCTYKKETFRMNNRIDLTNYLVKLDAKGTDAGIMFVAHYDSATLSYGAGDDGVGVAAMLEAVRQLSKRTDLKNDIYFLFTDGEEIRMLGAKYFSETKADYKDKIKLVVNVEARGNAGPLLMFETSKNNNAIIKMLKRSLSDITAFSFSAAVYRLMPNDTDLTEFLEEGYSGINFAVIDGGEVYHTYKDNYENLDKNTAYMYYKTMTELSRYLAVSDIETLNASEEAVYFPVWKGKIVSVSQPLAVILNILLLIAVIGYLVYMIYKRKVSFVKTSLAFGGTILSMAIGIGIVFLLNQIALNTSLFGKLLTTDDVIRAREHVNLCLFLMVIVFTSLWMWLSNRWQGKLICRCLGILPFLWAATAAVTILFPSASYLFAIPLLLQLIFILFHENCNSKYKTLISLASMSFSAIIVMILLVPMLILLYQGLFLYGRFINYGYYYAAVEAFFLCCIISPYSILLKNKKNEI